jgi:hypothetical protein
LQQPGKKTMMTPHTPHKPRIRYHGRTHYTVESRTRPGRLHHVDTYRLTCDCEACRYGKRCWALVAVLQYEDWRRRQQVQAATSPGQPTAMAALQDAFA